MSVRNCVFILWLALPKCMHAMFLIAVLLTIQAFGDCKSDCSNYDYYQEMERALISDNENLFKLRQMFFPVTPNYIIGPQDRLAFNVSIVVMNDQMSKSNSTSPTEMYWIFEYSSTLLTGLISPAQLLAFDFITTILMTETAGNFHTHRPDYNEQIKLQIQSFPCTATDQVVHQSAATLTSWFKAYARAHGIPHKWKEEDRGYVAIWYGPWNSVGIKHGLHHNYHHILRVNLLIAFIILNITVALILLRLVPQHYSHLVKTLYESSSHAANTLWAFVLFATGCNTLVYLFSFIFYGTVLHSMTAHCFKIPLSKCHSPFDSANDLYMDDLVSYITKVVTLLITMVVYLLLAACTPKVSRYPIPYSIQKLCYCFSCFCFCCRSKHSKTIQTFILYNILQFVHFTAMTIIPIGIFLLLSPARTIAVFATAVTGLLLILIIISNTLEFFSSQRRNTANQVYWKYQCVQLLAVVSLLVLIIVVLMSYTMLLLKGANTQGVYGIIWSILPSFLLSLVGWYIKWKFSRQQELQEVLNGGYIPLETDSDDTEEVI